MKLNLFVDKFKKSGKKRMERSLTELILSKFQELVSESNELWDHWYHLRPGENRIIMTCFPYQITMNHIKNIEKKAGGVLFYIRDSIQY